jgi:hypothetical protein
MSHRKPMLMGEKWGRLTVVRYVGLIRHAYGYECRCDCGGTRIVIGSLLRTNRVRDCGCTVPVNIRPAIRGRAWPHGTTPRYERA